VKSHTVKLPSRYKASSNTHTGGQGQVMVCRDKFLNRDVAIKTITDVTDTLTLGQEITALSSIQSKHVVQIFDLIKDPKDSYVAIIQEYLPGKDLSDFGSKPPPLGDYLKALFQIASGIADIHAHGRIHRDIKPVNMKFDAEDIIKIFDFGISCKKKPAHVTTKGMGTDIYRAPEIYGPAPVAVTSAVDVYAFGVTAWEMTGENFPAALLENPPCTSSAPPPFSSLKIGMPTEIAAVLDQTLLKAPEDRPQMSEIKSQIENRLLYLQHEGRLTVGQQSYKISGAKKLLNIKVANGSVFSIAYDGLKFFLQNLGVKIDINNIEAKNGSILPGSCVLALYQDGKNAREFFPFDISHPEVVL
jgi:serine/threonine protein kinase